ncbi:hypothetical protein HJFPF1_13542 [Paramyrothecium foliicola]|nr:hypothetical protein HJFPF1_13542 [Paramyrothecium foliicola]
MIGGGRICTWPTCSTQIARGEIDGTIFDHLGAAEQLISTLLSEPRQGVTEELFEFIIEFFTHMTTTSILSIDAQYRT